MQLVPGAKIVSPGLSDQLQHSSVCLPVHAHVECHVGVGSVTLLCIEV